MNRVAPGGEAQAARPNRFARPINPPKDRSAAASVDCTGLFPSIKSEQLPRCEPADLRPIPLRREVKHRVEQLHGLIELRHAATQFSPNHPVGPERFVNPFHQRLGVLMRERLL